MDTECGAAPCQDGWLATSRRGFFAITPNDTRSPDQIGLQRLAGKPLPGKPSIDGNTLFIADPFLGDVTAIDLSDEANPRHLAQLRLTGHPGRVRVHQGKTVIPAGRDGLLVWNYEPAGYDKPR